MCLKIMWPNITSKHTGTEAYNLCMGYFKQICRTSRPLVQITFQHLKESYINFNTNLHSWKFGKRNKEVIDHCLVRSESQLSRRGEARASFVYGVVTLGFGAFFCPGVDIGTFELIEQRPGEAASFERLSCFRNPPFSSAHEPMTLYGGDFAAAISWWLSLWERQEFAKTPGSWFFKTASFLNKAFILFRFFYVGLLWER